MSWSSGPGASFEALRSNAVGLAWVSHPVTVQGGALVVRELLGRRAVYRGLRADASALGDAVWTDADFRARVRGHVLELMRFRPVFPALARRVPRDTEFVSGARTNPLALAGSSVSVLSLGALFDDAASPDAGSYCPMRRVGGKPEPWLTMMFGHGKRQCPAQDVALTILTSALIGLLLLPELTWADGWFSRIGYDGPMVSRMRLRARRPALSA